MVLNRVCKQINDESTERLQFYEKSDEISGVETIDVCCFQNYLEQSALKPDYNNSS